MKLTWFANAGDFDRTWNREMQWFHARLDNTMLKMSNGMVRLGSFLIGLDERVVSLNERVANLEKASEAHKPRTATGAAEFYRPVRFARIQQTVKMPDSVVLFYGKRFIEAIGTENIATTYIETVLEEEILKAAKRVRHAKGLRDWHAEPETVEEAAVRAVRDLKDGDYRAGIAMAGTGADDQILIEVRRNRRRKERRIYTDSECGGMYRRLGLDNDRRKKS